jgi:hypothetical protein
MIKKNSYLYSKDNDSKIVIDNNKIGSLLSDTEMSLYKNSGEADGVFEDADISELEEPIFIPPEALKKAVKSVSSKSLLFFEKSKKTIVIKDYENNIVSVASALIVK